MSAIDVIETVRKMRAREAGYKEPLICERFDDFGKDGQAMPFRYHGRHLRSYP